MRGSPVRNTSSGIFRLVSNVLPDRVIRPRPRASLNSSSSVGLASMMNPRSPPPTSSAESSTSASTSSSTRPDPSARRPSSSAATCRRSPIAVVVARSVCGGPSASRKTSSAPPLRPRRIRSPWASGPSATVSPLTNVPYREFLSRMRKRSPSTRISAWSRDTSDPARRRSFVSRRPMENRPLSSGTMRRPRASVTSRRASGMCMKCNLRCSRCSRCPGCSGC